MKRKTVVLVVLLGLLFSSSGCIKRIESMMGVNSGSDDVTLKDGVIQAKYDKIKKIIVEEAINKGFPKLNAETKPSKANGWEGKLLFAVSTSMGTDQLVVEFDENKIKMHGSGTVTDVENAIKAIKERLEEL